MTRINTNVSSLNAQKSLARSNLDLQTALTRLSTGLRINVGKDDPAGLIASEVLRSDIIAVERAITNSERANQMIATADSALGQVSGLLNDIRGLVSEAANTGAMSEEQIAANQLQLDSSLEAMDRIAQVTSFQGRKLLDGNLDFITSGVDSSSIHDLQIQQANFGTLDEINVRVEVVQEAEQASLTYNGATASGDVVLEVGGSSGFEAFSFAQGSSVSDMASAINLVSDALGIQAVENQVVTTADTSGIVSLSSTTNGGADAGIQVTADTAGATAGDITIKYSDAAGVGALAATLAGGVITIDLATSSWGAAAAAQIQVAGAGNTIGVAAKIDSVQFNSLALEVTSTNAVADVATYDYAANKINVAFTNATNDLGDLLAVINSQLNAMFSAASVGNANATLTAAVTGASVVVSNAAGTDGGVINAGANTATLVAAAIDGETGVSASATGTGADAVTMFSHNATFGQENAGLATDTENGIQFLAPDAAADLPITFAASGTNQSLTIAFTDNTDTGGYSTAYIQAAAADATIKVTALNQGTQYDDVVISYQQHATDQAVVWDEENGTLQVFNDFDGGAVTATMVITQIDNAMGAAGANLFDAAAIGASTGLVATGESGTTTGGNEYTAITVNLATDANGTMTSTAGEVITAVNASTTMQTLGVSAANLGSSDGTGLVTTESSEFTEIGVTKQNAYASGTTANRGGQDAQMTVTARNAGALYDNVKVVVRNDATLTGGGDEYVEYNAATKELDIHIVSGTSILSDVLDNFTASNNPTEFGLFTLTAVGDGTGTLYSTDTGTLTGGVVDSGTADGGVAMVENHDAGDVVGSGLEFQSVGYGTDEFVSVKALEGTFQVVNALGQVTDRDTGVDVNLLINGIQAISDGLDVSINTSVLDLSFTIDSNVAANTTQNFQITGGGALFQLGPDVVSNQQARLGIQSLSTAKLGGLSGRLFNLRSGGTMDLSTDVMNAAAVVDEVITQVTNIRGRLGAFQRTTLETNINSMNDTLENLTAAESSIRDADFAAESAALTRAQILVQSGVSVLSIANSNPQNVLSLLR